jgi:hypothetical protein
MRYCSEGHLSDKPKEKFKMITTNDFYVKWANKNEELREKYNIPQKWGGQTWECFDGCTSGCYKGCDRKCYKCYILHDINRIDFA